MPQSRKKTGGGAGCLWILLSVGGLLLALGIMLSVSSIRGTEFCPNLFQVRDFAYSRIPGTGIRLSSTQLGGATPIGHTEVLKHLKVMTQQPIWHVATVNGWNNENHEAEILIQTLRQSDANGNNAWGVWSFDHPKLAAVLWPIVQAVAVQELYVCVPDLMQIAEVAPDPKTLEKQAFETVARAVVDRIEHATEDSEVQRLVSWFDGLPTTQETNPDWLQPLKDTVNKAAKTP